jgi:hypothetical protein
LQPYTITINAILGVIHYYIGSFVLAERAFDGDELERGNREWFVLGLDAGIDMSAHGPWRPWTESSGQQHAEDRKGVTVVLGRIGVDSLQSWGCSMDKLL